MREITYVGETQFFRGFNEQFSGQGITPELNRYVAELQEKLDGVESAYLVGLSAFENEEIDTTEYLAASQKYAAFDVQRKALVTIREKMAYVEAQTSQGYEAVILDSTGYDRLLEWSDSDRIMLLIALFGCIVLSALLLQGTGVSRLCADRRKTALSNRQRIPPGGSELASAHRR